MQKDIIPGGNREALGDSSARIAVTGIQASGIPHIGNYLGMIRPALELARTRRAYYFIADYHALTTVTDGQELHKSVHQAAATWLALGLDPSGTVLYLQSQLVEVFMLQWILSCSTSKGLLNRAHAYKAATESNRLHSRPIDDGVQMGLYAYPLLMAADILLMAADDVPVGGDQQQHVEMARDIAGSFNERYGPLLTLPTAIVDLQVATIPGVDGRKMSKSYGNVIPIFSTREERRRLVMRIVTDSRRPEEPKDPETCNVFALYKHFAPDDRVEEMRKRYLEGGVAYSLVKDELADLLDAAFDQSRDRYLDILGDTDRLDRLLRDGTRRARESASHLLSSIRLAVGGSADQIATW
jgi:tryptophanyl-tRNA synthetase